MIYITNTSIIPQNYEGAVEISNVSLPYVKELLEKYEFQSAIGHESTASLLTRILGIEIKMNRVQIEVVEGDVILAFQLKKRLQEAAELSEEELKSLEYSFREIRFSQKL